MDLLAESLSPDRRRPGKSPPACWQVGRGRRLTALLLLTWVIPTAAAAESAVGFLVAAAAPDKLGPEARAAWELAAGSVRRTGPGPVRWEVRRRARPGCAARPLPGALVPRRRHEQPNGGPRRPVVSHTPQVRHRRRAVVFVGRGAGCGPYDGIEPAAPRRGNGGNDAYFAQLIAVETEHPIFRGLSSSGALDAAPIPITDAGFPAYSDFAGSGGPTTGMLLARANAGDENPLVEYQLGQGRVIVLGWRLPHYSHASNAHRANLERLTGNILTYLGDAKQWQKVVVRLRPGATPESIGVPEPQWKSLALAIHD